MGNVVRLVLQIVVDGQKQQDYTVVPVKAGPNQERAFELHGEGKSYKLVQYVPGRQDRRRHDCSCPASKFNRHFSCKHVQAMRAAGVFDPVEAPVPEPRPTPPADVLV